MYKTILLTLDGTPTDRAIIEHIKQLAKLTQGRVVLLHVADGWAARTFGPDAVSPEITEDTAYLNRVWSEFQSVGIPVDRNWLTAIQARKCQMGGEKRLRPCGHEHAWTRLPRRSISGQRVHGAFATAFAFPCCCSGPK